MNSTTMNAVLRSRKMPIFLVLASATIKSNEVLMIEVNDGTPEDDC
jgi:hypothetical protein